MEYVSCSVFYDGLVDIAGTDTRIKSKGKSPLFRRHGRRHLRNTPAEIQIRDNTDLTNVKHFLFASTSSVYGDQKQMPIKEKYSIDSLFEAFVYLA